ncbi:hypothetical protein DLM45_06470 [Hyphomicrobium methylovorum]|uniref:hypothetical protein n=1 Tax=Hyphomicrobium methylovorum TaxID=84 RepID=UPI0015E6634D|nr:hypothetical protein [Hyphomicrobium methylovorum]MBA2125866.1 hypothetical protein [Hyphomicrobium methylovorum]
MIKIFDQAKSLANVDTNAFEIANVAGKNLAAQSTPTTPELYTPNFKADAFNAQLDNAYRSHIEANLPKPEVDQPELRETLKAAFQSGNMIGSALSSQVFAEHFHPTPNSPELTDDQILEQIGKANLMPHLQNFVGVTNQAQLNARIDDIEREQKNQTILEASGLTGTVALLLAGTVDIPTLIPVGKALQLGKVGASLLETAGKSAVAGAVDASVSEAGLQATQQLRTSEDGAINIASGAIIGAAIGGSIHVVLGDRAPHVEENLDKYREDAAHNFPEARAAVDRLDAEVAAANGVDASVQSAKPAPSSAGAAAVNFEELKAEAKARGELADAKVSAGLFDKVPSITTMPTEWLGKFLGGKTLLGQQRQAFRTSPLDNVRQFGRMFYSSPEISEANVQGLANGRRMTVEDHLDADRAALGRFKADGENIYAANKTRFKSAKDLAQTAYRAVLTEGIDKAFGDPAVEAVARSFRKYADYQRELHVKNGKLPEDLETIGADGYVRRIYNQTALRNDKGRAMSLLETWATRKVTADVEEELAHTQYTERLKAHEASIASYEKRMEFWHNHPERLKDWENRRDIANAQDRADYQTAMANWRDRISEHGMARDNAVAQDLALFKDAYRAWEGKVREFLSDPANDGKSHPYMLEKPKRSDFKTFEEGFDKGTPKPKKPVVGDYEGNIKSFDKEFGPRPRKGPEPLITENNAKPAVPKNKYGMPMLREHIPAYSKALAQDVYDTIAGVRSAIPNSSTSRVRVKSGYLQGRVIDIADDALAENFFLRTDLLEHAELMHNTSGKQAAFGSVFKTVDSYGNEVGDYTGNSILVDIAKEAQAKIDAASGDDLTKLTLDRDKYLQGVRNEVEHFLGTYDPGKGFGLLGPKAAHTLASLAYDVRLGGVTVSSLTDAPKIAISQGLGDTFKYGVLPMFTDFRNAVRKGGAMRDQGMRFGTVAEAVHATRLRDAFELNNPHQVGDKWIEFVDKSTQWATRLSGISYWTDWMKQITHNVVSSRILKYSTVGHERLSQKNQAWLANLGIEAHDLAKIGDEYARQDLKHVAGVLYADLDKWKDQDLAARFETAMRRENRNTIVTPGLGDRPQFTYDATGKLMYQFQSFMLIDQTRFLARQVQLANVGTDAAEKMRQRVALGAGLSSIVMASVFVDSLKRALRDNDADWEAFVKRWEDNAGGSMYDALDRSGIMGSLFTASNTVGKLSNGQYSIRGGTQWLAGDAERSEARKVRDIGLGGTLLGPAAGMAEDATKVVQSAARYAGGGTITRSDLRRFQNLTPYHAVPGIQNALNAVRELSATGMGLPPEETRH